MGEKDITEKILFDYNDVFADIFNALLFKGRQVIRPDDLEEAPVFSGYIHKGRVHGQERDVTKFWKDGHICLSLFGIENQTAVDPNIALRMISYDGAAYRAQLSKKDQREYFPVVSIVLYFGEKHWDSAKSLKERLTIRPELEPYVNDYKVQVFEIPYLEPEIVDSFHSDFRSVADYFVQVQKNKTYDGSQQQLDHVWEVFNLMSALTGDEEFAHAGRLASVQGGCSMFSILGDIEARGKSEGKKEGIAEGEIIGESRMAEKVQKALQELIHSQQISKEAAAILQSVTQQTGA